MYDVMEKENIKIEDMIYEIRGNQVMLDSDLAYLYKCANGTKTINLAVKRHIKRFPERFMFKLTDEESKNIWFQIETKNGKLETRGGKFYKPYVFTEQGVAMLATVLRTSVAEDVSIEIMDAFVKMRHFIVENSDIYKSLNNINNKLLEHNEKIDYLFSKFDKKEWLLLKGESFNGYLSILEVLNSAKNEIIIIDNYADITFLDLIRNIKCSIILITKNSSRLSNIEIDKYNREYHNLKVIRDSSFHDRFIVVDNNEIYICGSSINSIGNKTSVIVKIESIATKEFLINNIMEIINNKKNSHN